MIDWSEQHFVALPSQSSIYGLTTLENGCRSKTMALVASCSSRTSSRMFLVSFENYAVVNMDDEEAGAETVESSEGVDESCQRPRHKVNPVSKEIHFTYIPGGAEIISIDSFNKSSSKNDFVVGITFSKPADSSSMQYFNVYTDWEETTSLSLESIAQSCISLKLDFVPYHLYHTEIRNVALEASEIDWLLSGSDGEIHLFREDTQQHTYCEHSLDDYFPEFIDLRRIVLWMDVAHYDRDGHKRLAVIGCEDGYVRATITSVADNGHNEVLCAWDVKHDSPISRVAIFSVAGTDVARPTSCLDWMSAPANDSAASKTFHVLVASTLETAVVYSDVVTTKGFGDQRQLPCSDHFDCVQCACIADIDFDGHNEIVLGTYGHEMLVYKCSSAVAGEFSLIKQRSFAYPLLSIDYADVTGDGLNELVVLSTKGLHILQHDLNDVATLLQERIERLCNAQKDERHVVTDS